MIDRFDAFVGTITEINRLIGKIKTLEMGDFGLKGSHVMTLFRLRRAEGGLTATELREASGEDKAAVSRTVTELREKGFITDGEDGGGKRWRARLTLTEKGKEVTAKMDKIIIKAVEKGSEGNSDGDREIFYRMLAQIKDNLTEFISEEEKR